MARVMLPASPSWYCSRVLDSNNSGLMCFGARHSIYVFDTSISPTEFRGHIPAHSDRVVGVSFCKFLDQSTSVCSASEDGKVKIWDLRDNTLSGEHSEHKNKLTTVHWSTVDKNLIVSGDDKGGLVIWQPSTGGIRSFCPELNAVFSLTCSSHAGNLVAVGYKNGLVLVLDLSRKSGSPVLQKLRGHDDEIHSIVWSPTAQLSAEWRRRVAEGDRDAADDDGEAGNKPTDYVLATGSRDKTIRLWSMLKSKTLCTLNLPRSTGQRRGWEDGASKQRVWVTLNWPSHCPNQLVSSSFNGDLVLWDLARPGSKSFQIFGSGGIASHNRIVFNISPAGVNGQDLCSISMDRQLICWNIDSLSATHAIPSLGGFVYCIAQSPIHSGRLAVGVGDNLIRVWNVENPSEPYDARVFWQGIKSKVTALSWHPKKEAHLAFGTDDGRVGILDILSSRSHLSGTYHKRTVYVVAWGPPCCETGNKPCETEFVLYSCGDGNVLQHDPVALDKPATNVNMLIKKNNNMETRPPGRSEISWKPDYSLVAFGNEDGTIDIHRPPNLQQLCTIQVHRKLVNCVRWHPEYTAESVEPSKCSYWIASGSNEPVVHVVDLRKSVEAGSSAPMVITESFCQLEGHTNRITGLCWSIHSEGQLVSASYDWTAQVWDVKKCEAVANFRAHHGRLLSVLWSSLDPDIVYSGGDDFTLQAWNISQQTYKSPPAGSEKRKHKNKPKSNRTKLSVSTPQRSASPGEGSEKSDQGTGSVGVGAGDGVVMAEIQELLEKKRAELSAKEAGAESLDTAGEDQVAEVNEAVEGLHLEPSASLSSYPKPVTEVSPKKEQSKKDLKDKARRKARSLFPLSSAMDNRGKLHTQDDCVDLVIAKTATEGPSSLLPKEKCHLGHFLDRQNCYQLFDHEISHHMEQGNHDQYTILEAFRGDIGKAVNSLSDKAELNDFTVAMSAMASTQTWRATCVAYAKQLEREGNYPKAASYLLASQQVYEAIDMLKRNAHYKDAVCLARARLSPHDPVLRSLYASWGYQLASDGNFELAAKCYIANDQPVEAARLLARRADLSALSVASEICLSCGDLTNACVYSLKHTQQCMLALNWAGAAELLTKHKQLQLHGLMLSTHQSLLQHLSAVGSLPEIDVTQGAPYIAAHRPGPSGDSKFTLPLLFVNDATMKDWLPWVPYTIDGQAFITDLVRKWHNDWGLVPDLATLQTLDTQLTVLSRTRQAHTALKQILIEIANFITTAVVKLLLGNLEAAAHWLTLAFVMCEENQLENVSEGLCQLLLPTGPEHLIQIKQQVRALRHVAVQEQNSALEVAKVEDDHDLPVFLPANRSDVIEDLQVCSSMDCLEAFYLHRVLKVMISRHSKGSGSTARETKTETVVCLREISQSLLRGCQLEKKKLLKTTALIRRATAALITQHSGSKHATTDVPPIIDCDTVHDPHLAYPSTPNIGEIKLEAFHRENRMILSNSQKDISQATEGISENSTLHAGLPPYTLKPHERLLYSPLKSPIHNPLARTATDPAELTPMDSVMEDTQADFETSTLETLPESPVEDSRRDSQKCITNGQHDGDESPTAYASMSPDWKGSTVTFYGGAEICDSVEEAVYSAVPPEWNTMSPEKKYTQDYVDLRILSAEQEKIQRKISKLNQFVKDTPFPDPEVSLLSLLQLSHLLPESQDLQEFVEQITLWGEKHKNSSDVNHE